jgi:hypothetical protein
LPFHHESQGKVKDTKRLEAAIGWHKWIIKGDNTYHIWVIDI